jgi:DNA modification methylase
MKDIEDKSIDMILCDLPYGVTQNNWDSVINLDLLWQQYERIIKDKGIIILFGQDKFTAKVMLSNEKLHRYNLIWKKGNRGSGFLNANRMPLRNHEDIMIFYKSLPIYNPQMEIGEKCHSRGQNPTIRQNNNYGKYDLVPQTFTNEKYPMSILDYKKPHPSIHPTEKPVELGEYLIKTYSNIGDIVLDNTCGSGSFLVAAKNLKRNFIGIEKEQEYIDIANKRLEEIPSGSLLDYD